MMQVKTITGLILLLFIGISNLWGQENLSGLQLIQKIDSISINENINKGEVKILYVSNIFDNTETREKSLTKVAHFKFDGIFLVIDDKYFNINKLLYFCVRNEKIEFYFQGY